MFDFDDPTSDIIVTVLDDYVVKKNTESSSSVSMVGHVVLPLVNYFTPSGQIKPQSHPANLNNSGEWFQLLPRSSALVSTNVVMIGVILVL